MPGRRIQVQGSVQGVGFRPWVWRLAHELGVTGWVRNGSQGVTIEAFAPLAVLDDLVTRLGTEAPPAAWIRSMTWAPIDEATTDDFVIVKSDETREKRVSIPPDLATCDACLAEVRDPANRRYRYAFTNCTDCGPRFTISEGVPYDRPATTMARFQMCPECQAEYDDPRDRRFHAQPNACPVCGPRLSLVDAAGQPLPGDPLDGTVAALRRGELVAIKGLGGFHLACDASDDHAVARLRDRKHREEKPFAVMVRDLDEARRLTVIGPEEAKLLSSVQRPIVLLRPRSDGPVSALVAPGAPRAGLMLPYTPLHHLLLGEFGGPLVMTSGNVSDEPIAHTNAGALAHLGAIADCFLLHDRDITTRTDDSVATVFAGAPMVWRRSRGYVPVPIPALAPFREPVLAVGAHLKNTFCLGVGDTLWLGPHIGDLETLATFESLVDGIDRMERFLGVEARVVAHDLHPGYQSTEYAMGRPGRKIAVQHHHAHVAAAMAEHGLRGPVLGIAFDGTGYGPDGSAWGGEVLRVDAHGYKRLATLRPIPLAGGDLAMRQPWRVALALLDDAFGSVDVGDFALFSQVDPQAVAVARKQIRAGVNAPLAHGVGRLFDGVASLCLARPEATYEGQLAMAWEQVAGSDGEYAFDLHGDTIDPRPMIRELVADLHDGAPNSVISGRFHRGLVDAVERLVRRLLDTHGLMPVVLTGGCFQNARLSTGLRKALEDLDVRVHRSVPPGDGGISLGQATVAGTILARESTHYEGV